MSGIRGDFVVVSFSMFGGIDSYFFGFAFDLNNCRGCARNWLQKVSQQKNKCILLQGGGERIMARMENGEWVSFLFCPEYQSKHL